MWCPAKLCVCFSWQTAASCRSAIRSLARCVDAQQYLQLANKGDGLILSSPCSFFVFQNSGHEFHDDLYPDTVGTTPAMSAEEWWKGGNKQVRDPYFQSLIQSSRCTGSSSCSFYCRWRELACTQTNVPNKRQHQQNRHLQKRKWPVEGARRWDAQLFKRWAKSPNLNLIFFLKYQWIEDSNPISLPHRIKLATALPPAVLWALPAAAPHHLALLPPPPASPQALFPAPVPARVPRLSKTWWVKTN